MVELKELLEQSQLAASYAYSRAYRLHREGRITKRELRKVRTILTKTHALCQTYEAK